MFSLRGTISRRSASRLRDVTETKRSFSELGYFKPKYAEYGDDDFVEDDMYDSVESFQKDHDLEVDGRMRPDGPTQQRANAELLKRRRKALDPDGSKGLRDSPGLGLEDAVGQNATNKPSDVQKVKYALSAAKLYPNDKRRLNDGRADEDLRFGVGILEQKYGIGVQNGKIKQGSIADKYLFDIAAGNDPKYLGQSLQAKLARTQPKAPVQQRRPSAALENLLKSANETDVSHVPQDTERNIGAAARQKQKGQDTKETQLASSLAKLFTGVTPETTSDNEEQLNKEMAENTGDLIARALSLPSKNYTPEKVRNNKTPQGEFDEENAKGVVSGLLELGNRLADNSSATQEGAMDFSVVTKEGQEANWKKTLEEQGIELTNASATESVSEEEAATQPDPTHQGRTKRETVERGEESHEVALQQIKSERDENKNKTIYKVTSGLLTKLYPDITIPKEYDSTSIYEWQIFGREGTEIITKGDVPLIGRIKDDIPHPNSGVTIGFGFDLGRRNEADLAELVKPGTPLYNKLKPYLGLIGKKAQDFVRNNPLVLSEGEALALSRAAYRGIHKDMEEAYDNAAGKSKGDFAKLSKPIRTAMLSVAVQYGSINENNAKRFWGHALNGDCKSMVHELKNYGDAHSKRRKDEASYLEKHC